jgi:PAS domain S-box-containing protein
LAAIVDNSEDAIIGKDLNSIVTSWNKAAERVFGYSAEEMIGTSIVRLIPQDRRAEEEEILSRIKRGERYDNFDTIRVTKDGRQVHVSLTISPIKDANGYVVGASKIAHDITERKQADKALEEARKIAEAANAQRQRLLETERAARSEAERVNRMKDEFLATLSHELRTPLNAVLGWATILRAGSFRTGDLTQGLEAIERNARIQAQMIGDLLDMSRIISGKARLEVQRLDLPIIVVEAIETLRSAASRKGVRLEMVIDPLDAPFSGDPNRLQQVFWNLLSNAIKFTPKGGRIQVLLERVDSSVEISIVDNGEGISPEFLPYIFNRFEQADASRRTLAGTAGNDPIQTTAEELELGFQRPLRQKGGFSPRSSPCKRVGIFVLRAERRLFSINRSWVPSESPRERWHGAIIEAFEFKALATYLGHVDVASTQRYLTMTAELLNEASLRFERYAQPEVRHA